MARKPQSPAEAYKIVLVILKQKGCRVEYGIKLNEKLLEGKIIRTAVKGQPRWTTTFRKEELDHYDPQWLIHQDKRRAKVVLGADHPHVVWAKKQPGNFPQPKIVKETENAADLKPAA